MNSYVSVNPDPHLAWLSVGLIAVGLLLIAAATVTAGRDHRRNP